MKKNKNITDADIDLRYEDFLRMERYNKKNEEKARRKQRLQNLKKDWNDIECDEPFNQTI